MYEKNESETKHPLRLILPQPIACFLRGATFTRASAKTCAGREPTKVEPAIDWLRALRSLPKESGSLTVERYTSRSASQSSLPLIRQEAPIDSEISVIVAALTLASTMAGFGRPMCPLEFISICPYLHPGSASMFPRSVP